MGGIDRRGFMRRSAMAGAAAWGATNAAMPREMVAMAAGGDLFMAGVAVRDITPAPGLPLWGYTDAGRIATGTRDPLHARAIAFRAGGKTAAIVTLDLGRMPTRDRMEALRARALQAGIDAIAVTASHTHSGPMMEMPGLPHLDAIDAAIVETAKAAADALAPARVGVGRCAIDIAHNRRAIKQGQCFMLWRNERRLPTAPIDPEAVVVRIDGPGGKAMATLVHYACHPVVFGPDNLRYSADWAGAMCRAVERATGAPCLFVQGACGDINPYLDKTPLDAGADKAVDEEGGKAAAAAIACRKATEAIPPKAPSLAWRAQRVETGLRWDLADAGQAGILRTAYGPMYDAYLAPYAADPSVPVDVLLLNGSLAFVFFPGEPFVRFQIDLKRDSPLRDTLLCGYANEFHAYFPTTGAALVGGYGASSATYVGLGAGDRIMTEAKIALGTLLGRVRPLAGLADLQSIDLPASEQDPAEWGRYFGGVSYQPVKF